MLAEFFGVIFCNLAVAGLLWGVFYVTLLIAERRRDRKAARMIAAAANEERYKRVRGFVQATAICDCTDGTDPDEPDDRGFICEHDPRGKES